MIESGFIVNLTHDIDFVRKTYQYITHDLFKKKFSNLKSVISRKDPYWTFDTIMKVEDDTGCRSTFFFLEESMPWKPFQIRDWNLTLGKYRFSDPAIKNIIKTLDKEKWEIALHGSYNSYRDKQLLAKEKKNLEEVIEKPVEGVRQHFLNLDIPDTWIMHKELGLKYDASLSRKRDIGFYNKQYKPVRNTESGMVIIPLTLMDTYISVMYKGDVTKAWRDIIKIIDEAESNNAVLSILWHNNYFNEKEHPGFTKLYTKIIWECKNRRAKFLTSGEIYQLFNRIESGETVREFRTGI